MTSPTIPPCPVCGKAPMLVPPSLPKLPTIKRYLNVDCECVIRALGQLVSLSDWTKGVNATLGRACRELGIETVERLRAKVQPDPRVAELSGYITVLLDLATDAANGLEYVRDVHGDLYGVGFDRVKIKAEVLPVIRLKMIQLISAQRGEG